MTAKENQQLAVVCARDITPSRLNGENIDSIIDQAPGVMRPLVELKSGRRRRVCCNAVGHLEGAEASVAVIAPH